MSNKSRVSVQSYYELGWEKDRLTTGKGHAQAIEGKIENCRTLDLLDRYITKPNAIIVDLGCRSLFFCSRSSWSSGTPR